MNTMHHLRAHLSGLLALFLLALPLSPALAQAVDSPTPPADTTTPPDAASAPATPADALPTADVPPPADASLVADAPPAQPTIPSDTLVQTQDTGALSDVASSTQETIPSDTLVQTQDPNAFVGDTASSTVPLDPVPPTATSTPVTPPVILDATSTAPVDTTPISGAATSTDPAPAPIIPDVPPPDVATSTPEVVATMPMADINPRNTFKFNIKSARIATERVPAWKRQGGSAKKGDINSKVISSATVVPDSVSGAPVVSGSCSNVYYVILLYRNQTDYSDNPGSFILNNAYPCVNGQYSYAIKELPMSIPNGTYYLLVAEEGNTGSWSPITSLVPIDISR